MFREMRRKDRQIYDELVTEILEKGEYGVLSTIGEHGYPYGVPVNYAYHQDSIYFHCAKTGHKLDAIKEDSRVSFCVVTDTELLPADFSTKYKSVIAFGNAKVIDGDEKKRALLRLVEKYSPGFKEEGKSYVDESGPGTTIVKITIEHITGKARL